MKNELEPTKYLVKIFDPANMLPDDNEAHDFYLKKLNISMDKHNMCNISSLSTRVLIIRTN